MNATLDTIVISNKAGISLYSRKFSTKRELDSNLLSGLITAIDAIGDELFKKKIATITFGEENFHAIDEAINKIVVISKEVFSQDKRLNFTFLCSGDHSLKRFRELATNIFIEIKGFLLGPNPDRRQIRARVDHIIETRFQELLN